MSYGLRNFALWSILEETVAKAGSDTLAVGLTDASAVQITEYILKSVSESLAIGFTDTSVLDTFDQIAKAGSDTLAIGLADTSSLLQIASRSLPEQLTLSPLTSGVR